MGDERQVVSRMILTFLSCLLECKVGDGMFTVIWKFVREPGVKMMSYLWTYR